MNQQQLRSRAQTCLADLDAMLQPATATPTAAQRAELLAAGVSARRIAALYPLNLRAYTQGVDRLCEREDLFWEMTSELGDAALEAMTDAYQCLLPNLLEDAEIAVSAVEVEAGSNLLRLVAFAHLLAHAPLAMIFNPVDPAAALLRGQMDQVADFVARLRRWSETTAPEFDDQNLHFSSKA